MLTTRNWIAAGIAAVAFVSFAVARNDLTPKNRRELKHDDVPGTNMEMIVSVAEYPPGASSPVTFITVRKDFMCFKEQCLKHQTARKSHWLPGSGHQPSRRSTWGAESGW
jgi:hypothetical protein